MRARPALTLALALLALARPAPATTVDAMPKTRNSPRLAEPARVKADPFSGSASYAYRFEVPPGTGGLTPALVLSYNTRTHGTEYGYGWTLSLGAIERSTRLQAPFYDSPLATGATADAFELEGDLLVRDGTSDAFRLRYSDGSLVRYDEPSNSWEVTKPDGARFLYGTTEGSRLVHTLDPQSPLAVPAPEETFRWSLSEVIDPRGNAYRIVYAQDLETTPDGTVTYTTYVYPERIEYSLHHGSPVGSLRLITFEWGPRRNAGEPGTDGDTCDGVEDCPTSYRAGFKVQQRRRLVNVTVGIDANGDKALDASEQVRRYALVYAPKTSAAEPEAPPYSQLVAIQRYGRNDTPFPSAAAPLATTFGYSDTPRSFEPTPTDWGAGGGPPEIEDGLTNVIESSVSYLVLDMNGDGIPDRVSSGIGSEAGNWTVAFGTPTGFARDAGGAVIWTSWPWSCTGYRDVKECNYLRWTHNGITKADLIDMNGDGRPDRVTWGPILGLGLTVYPNTGAGFGPPEEWAPPDPPACGAACFDGITGPGQSWNSVVADYPEVRRLLADLNGDGRPEYIPDAGLFYKNNGQDLENLSSAFGLDALPGPSDGPPLEYTLNHLADVNGDGLPDRIVSNVCFDGDGEVLFGMGAGPIPGSEGTEWSPLRWQTNSDPYPGFFPVGHLYKPPGCVTDPDSYPWLGSVETVFGADDVITGLADLNGDGIPDYVVTDDGPSGFEVYLGLGDGRFLTTGPDGPGLDPDVMPAGIDWERGPIPVFAESAPLGGLPVHRRDVGRHTGGLLDMNGDGLADYVRTLDEVYLHHQGPTGLLEVVHNEIGGVTTIEYTVSTAFEPIEPPGLEELDAGGQPALPPEILPDGRPRWLVSRMTLSDGRPETPDEVQDLVYAGFRFDTDLREAFGARMAESADAAGLVTRNLFHQQPALRGRPEYAEECDAVACYWSQETLWVDVTEADPSRIPGSYLPRPEETLTTLCDETATLCDESAPARQERIVKRMFDPRYGNLEKELDCGRDADCADEGDNRVRTLTYAENSTDWMVSQVNEESTWFGNSTDPENLVSQVRLHYDTGTFVPGAPTPPVRCAPGQSDCGGLVRFRETLRDATTDTWAVEEWQYDAYGNPTSYHDPEAFAASGAATWTASYDTPWSTFPISIQNALGHESTFRFDEGLGDVTKALAPNGHLGCWTYDDFGRLEARSEADAAVGDIENGACNVPLAAFSFPELGDPTRQRIVETLEAGADLDPVRSLRLFDGLGREYQTETEGRVDEFDVVTRSWDDRGALACTALPYRRSGGFGGVAAAFCPDQYPHRATRYDPLGRPTQVDLVTAQGTSVVEVVSTYGIDAFGGGPDPGLGDLLVERRLTKGAPSPDREQYLGRDTRGNVVFVRDGIDADQTTILERDPKGRITRVDGPDVALVGGTDPNLIEIAYNAVDQRVALTQPPTPGALWPGWAYEYDLNGALVTQTSPRGVSIDFHYDALGRPILKDYAPPSTPTSPSPGDLVYTYYDSGAGLGQLESVYAVNGLADDFDYDLRGRVATKTRDYGGSLSFVFSYQFDLLDRPLVTTLPDDGSVTAIYDGAQLDTLRSDVGGFTDVLVSGLERHPSGGLTALRLESPLLGGIPVESAYTYWDSDHRLKTALTTLGGSTVAQDLAYGYDTAGNLLSITDGRAQPRLSQTFGYDPLHRLETAFGSGSQGYGELGYVYDPAGNLREKGPQTGGQPASGRIRLHYDRPASGGPASVTSVDIHNGTDWLANLGAYDYDADGGMILRRVLFSSYTVPVARDPDGRLTTLTLPGHQPYAPKVESYLYGPTGERSEKTKTVFGGVEADRLYVDAGFEVDVVAETHEVHLFVGSRRVATSTRPGLGTTTASTADAVEFYHPDHVGSNTVVTDGAGQVVQETFLRPFGEIHTILDGAGQPVGAADSATPYLFTDQERDAETGLHYFGARYYDAWVGRFMSQDPELIGAGGSIVTGLATEPDLQNPYAYALNRPTVMSDPAGRLPYWASGTVGPVTSFVNVVTNETVDSADVRMKNNEIYNAARAAQWKLAQRRASGSGDGGQATRAPAAANDTSQSGDNGVKTDPVLQDPANQKAMSDAVKRGQPGTPERHEEGVTRLDRNGETKFVDWDRSPDPKRSTPRNATFPELMQGWKNSWGMHCHCVDGGPPSGADHGVATDYGFDQYIVDPYRGSIWRIPGGGGPAQPVGPTDFLPSP